MRREDKMFRSIDSSDNLLLAIRQAIRLGDEFGQRQGANQLLELASIAKKTGDRALANRVDSISRELSRAIDNPRSMRAAFETKARAAVKADATDEDDDASAEPLGEIAGYGSTFGNVDLGGDIVMPGAFRASLASWKAQGRLPPMLAVHDMSAFPIGAWTEMSEDSRGLRVKGAVANTPRGREAWALINMQPSALDGLSIGYQATEVDFDRNGNRLLNQIDLFEVSVVQLPMNPAARLQLPKSCAHSRLETAIAKLGRLVSDEDRGSNVLHFPRCGPEIDEDDAELLAALRDLNETLRA
jgi:HK97 family phage prohead protease